MVLYQFELIWLAVTKALFVIFSICINFDFAKVYLTRLILGFYPANERRRYKVTTSLIGWAQT